MIPDCNYSWKHPFSATFFLPLFFSFSLFTPRGINHFCHDLLTDSYSKHDPSCDTGSGNLCFFLLPRISSLLIADDVVQQFTRTGAVCGQEWCGTRISTSKSDAMVLSQGRVECSLWVSDEMLPQVRGEGSKWLTDGLGRHLQWCTHCTGPSW